jgi:hypothetical protein
MAQPTNQTVAIDIPATFFVEGDLTDESQGNIFYQWQINETNLANGTVSLGSTILTVSGANTQTLTISSNSSGINSIRAVLTHPVAGNSPLFSNTVQFDVVEPRSIIKIEGYNNNSSTAYLHEVNLDEEDLVFTSSLYNYDIICLYASEKDIEMQFDLYGAKGSDIDYSLVVGDPPPPTVGGEGGYSRITLNMQKNDEYVILGVKQNSSISLYRKSSLVSVVGQGGNAGPFGDGGPGGGVNIAGQNGSGPNSGKGGVLVPEGSLDLNGIFGSFSNPSLVYPEDTLATGRVPGQTISCTKGIYWREQGISPCNDIGQSKFRLSDGTLVTNSATINRGFKSGYSIIQTAGRGLSNLGAHGGNGATGGEGGDRGGGGGGSGYSDGTIDILETRIGGNASNARVNVRVFDGGFYVDDFGRILILSNTDGRDPRTLTKTGGIVNIGDNAAIDDIRWQRFLDLARDGSQNYRLTATLNNSTIPVTNATDRNIYRMINANNIPLRNSLTGWVDTNYAYTLLALAWDETDASGGRGFGSDYSILSWSPPGNYGFGYYGQSTNPFFSITTYSKFSANYWILPPGVPDFS